jgi:hypothetical protein
MVPDLDDMESGDVVMDNWDLCKSHDQQIINSQLQYSPFY